ncbi:MAG: MBOAT family protein [Leptospiraceae bacterium]|nr:MBOAT family protein [Leptospiraceae bacterium]
MLFVSSEFLIFFIIVYLLYWAAPLAWRFYVLLAASLFFYMSWSPLFALHLLAVIVINYYVLELYRRTSWKGLFVALQIANVANIAVFKYFYFIAGTLGFLFGIDAWHADQLRLSMRAHGNEILLPLAISFYTFQIMSYGIDLYRRTYTEKHSLTEFILFISFFPQLIAGPIMRADDLMPQIARLKAGHDLLIEPEQLRRGLWLLLAGIFKKVVIADTLLIWTMPAMQSSVPAATWHPVVFWQASLGFLFMLYADFSAYSDLARGFGHLLGIQVPLNFQAPFFMKSISDFWRRWHLTFSFWIRDYIFIPLGGSRGGNWQVVRNLILTFFLAGLWHGASNNFVIWGTLMGILLALESQTFRWFPEWPRRWYGRFARLLVTWLFFVPVTLFFFVKDVAWTLSAIVWMFNPLAWLANAGNSLGNFETLMGSALAVICFHLYDEYKENLQIVRRFEGWLLPLAALILIGMLLEFSGKSQDFFYFQF